MSQFCAEGGHRHKGSCYHSKARKVDSKELYLHPVLFVFRTEGVQESTH